MQRNKENEMEKCGNEDMEEETIPQHMQSEESEVLSVLRVRAREIHLRVSIWGKKDPKWVGTAQLGRTSITKLLTYYFHLNKLFSFYNFIFSS